MLALTYPDGPRVQRCEYLLDKPALSLANETRLVSRASFTDHHHHYDDDRHSLRLPRDNKKKEHRLATPRTDVVAYRRRTSRHATIGDDGKEKCPGNDRRRTRRAPPHRISSIVKNDDPTTTTTTTDPSTTIPDCRYCWSKWCRSASSTNLPRRTSMLTCFPGGVYIDATRGNSSSNNSSSSSSGGSVSSSQCEREKSADPNDRTDLGVPTESNSRESDDDVYHRRFDTEERGRIKPSGKPAARVPKERFLQFVLIFVLMMLGCSRHCGPFRSKVNRTAFSVFAISSAVARGAECSPINLINDPGVRSERSANLSHITGTSRKIQMYVKNRHLQIFPDGTVNGSRSDASDYTILQRMSVSRGQLRIQGVATCLYLCMDSCGFLYGSREYTEECLFNETLELHNYNTYSSIRWSTPRKTLYLGLSHRGQSKKVQAKGHDLGRLSAYARVLTKVVPTDRVEALQRRMLDDQHRVRHHHGSQQIVCPPVIVQERDGRDQLRCRKRKKRKKKKRRCREGEIPGPQCDAHRDVGSPGSGIESPQSKRSCEGAASDEACRREALEAPSKKRKSRIEATGGDYDLEDEVADDEIIDPPQRKGSKGPGRGGGGQNRKKGKKPQQNSTKKMNQKKAVGGNGGGGGGGGGGGRKNRKQQGPKKKTSPRVTRTTVTVERRRRPMLPTTLPASWYPGASSSLSSSTSVYSSDDLTPGKSAETRNTEASLGKDPSRNPSVTTVTKFLKTDSGNPVDLHPHSDLDATLLPSFPRVEDAESHSAVSSSSGGVDPEEAEELDAAGSQFTESNVYPDDADDATDPNYDVDEEDEEDDILQLPGPSLDRFAM